MIVALSISISAAGVSLTSSTRAADREADERPVVIGSKVFTESVILGELLTQTLQASGIPAAHRRELGGTRVLWDALEKGDVDAYVEYTGTIEREVLAADVAVPATPIEAMLAKRNVAIAARLGFNNSYVLGVRHDVAQRLGLERISDLRAHPELRFGFSNEFMNRGDGWPGLQAAYGLAPVKPRGMQHDLAYRGIESGAIDVTDLYSTDAEIVHYRLARLDDDLGYFPRYEAVIVYRRGLRSDAVAALARLEGVLDETTMARLNEQVRIGRRSERDVAAEFLRTHLPSTVQGGRAAVTGQDARDTRWQRLLDRTEEHLALVVLSLGAAILVSVPLGLLSYLKPWLGEFVLGFTGVLQTIPALALLVFMIPWFGIGAVPAIAALFLYSLLPIVRNTHVGLSGIPASVRESAIVLGLPTAARLRLVELPLAAPSILAGIKTAAVINIGTATLGALIGAGGYGEPILTGIRLDDMGLILEGAVPAALLALAVQSLRPLRFRRRR